MATNANLVKFYKTTEAAYTAAAKSDNAFYTTGSGSSLKAYIGEKEITNNYPVTSVNSKTGAVSLTAADVSAIATSAKGAANGVATLDANGKVPQTQLPSYVDDVLEYANKAALPVPGEAGKIYVTTNDDKCYRWPSNGTAASDYVEISKSVAYELPTATSSVLGGIKIGYTSTANNRAVQLSSDKAYVNVPNMGAATASAAGTAGLVPAPAANNQGKYLRGDGTWQTPTNTTYSVFTGATSSADGSTGLVTKPLIANRGQFLRGDGTWATPANTTYSAGSGLSLSSTTINHSNSVTAKTAYGSTATTAAANGGSFTVTDVKYDAQGHITGSTDRTITLSQTTYSLSGLGGVGSVTASGTAPLTLDASKSGTAVTITGSVATMTGASATDNGAAGLVPAALKGNQSKFLRGDGTWQYTPNTDTKVNVVLGTTTKAYLLGTSTTPTATAAGVTAIADTGVYLDTTAGKLTATSFAGNGASLTSLNASNISSGTLNAARLPTVTGTPTTSSYSVAVNNGNSISFVDCIEVDSYGRVTKANTNTTTLVLEWEDLPSQS